MSNQMVVRVLLKALTNLPHSDFICCKALLTQENLEEPVIKNIQYMHDLLEMCQFKTFWAKIHSMGELVRCVAGFEDLVRKFVCHVISITYQNIQVSLDYEMKNFNSSKPQNYSPGFFFASGCCFIFPSRD